MKVSNYIINLLENHNAKHVFIICGAGNMHLLNSLGKSKQIEYICPHHEQAGVMAAMAYHRISGRPGIMMTTSGGGASNAITGVLDAWADSIPCMIISGQERTKFVKEQKGLRMWGVQGFDIAQTVKNITKYSVLIDDPKNVRYEFEKAIYIMNHGRPGPVWIDIPIDIQGMEIDENNMRQFIPEPEIIADISSEFTKLIKSFERAKRPVFLIGNGIRLAGGEHLIKQLINKFKIPYLTSWNGADLISSDNNLYFGREGNYGQRCANFIVQNCDLLVSIGSRLAIPQVGYELKEFCRDAKKFVIDIDETELSKFYNDPSFTTIQFDAKLFIEKLIDTTETISAPAEWIIRCNQYKKDYPVYDADVYKSKPGFINSYTFINKLAKYLNDEEIIVTDMGTALTCTFQSIILKENQRIISSTGLGEMGYGLPAAIGACLANNMKRVILIVGDGSMMMNLQELQTIIHHNLPIKIFLYCNDGYLSIKHTQIGLFGNEFDAVGKETGVSCPDFQKIGSAFGFKTFRENNTDNLDTMIQEVLNCDGAVICQIDMEPYQPLLPKLSFALTEDGSMISPPLEDLSPFIPREKLKKDMIIGIHEKSNKIS